MPPESIGHAFIVGLHATGEYSAAIVPGMGG